MPAVTSVENNFTKGLITEFSGLNFPENAATDTDNCEYTLTGDVKRRLGFDLEANTTSTVFDRTAAGQSSYVWNNAGGDGEVKLYVRQIGRNLLFYSINNVVNSSSLSRSYLSSIDISVYRVFGTTFDATSECTYADGNGYLFVYNKGCEPFYISYSSGNLSANAITIKVRDFTGIPEAGPVTDRPVSLINKHIYNLVNQGWAQGAPWSSPSSTTHTVAHNGSFTFTVSAGMSVTNGDTVNIYALGSFFGPIPQDAAMVGSVTSYAGTTIVINVYGDLFALRGLNFSSWNLVAANKGYINTWFAALGNYPSNADVWWYFKDTSNIFNPAITANQVTINSGNAPRGHFVLNAFDQLRSQTSALAGLTDITTSIRPTAGAWFQGRVWYTGINANQAVTGDAPFYTWTENIYFSQIVQGTVDFGNCYQTNDPSSEILNGLLPTDGGVITIPGTGVIHKLFPIANGMLVFANNGVWFITGSQGIGFSANDYTVTHISSVKVLSPQSFVDVMGLPYFWNEEGIYQVVANQQGSLRVDPITVGTILTYYSNIPIGSKFYARGDYNPIDYVIQWTFRSASETNSTDRYEFDKLLNFNVYNKAFFPYSVSRGNIKQSIHGVNYISYPNVTQDTPEAGFVYPSSYLSTVYNQQFTKEYQTTYKDWDSLESTDYDSFFITGYKLHGQGQRRFQIPYIYVFSNNAVTNGYKIQGIWDYASNANSGRWSVPQLVLNVANNFGLRFRRHVIRGRGLVLQLKVSSVTGQPFDILGWSTFEIQNAGV